MYQQKPHLFCFNGLVTVIGKDNQMSHDIAKRKIRANRKPYQYIFFIFFFFHSRGIIQMLFSQCEYVYEFVCMYLTVLYDMHSSPGRFLYYTSHPFFLLLYGV